MKAFGQRLMHLGFEVHLADEISAPGIRRGDLIVQIEVETPTKLTAKQRELLEAFRATETGEECPETQGFFAKVKKALG